MTEFEKWSLAFTAIGHLFVATSILYAARQWLISQKSFEREIIKDTRNYISSINDQIHMYQREIVKNDLNPWESSHGIDDCRPINQLLNTIEDISAEIESEFYDRGMLKNYFKMHSCVVWNKWHPYIENLRCSKDNNNLWINIEMQAKGYNNGN